MQETKAKVIPLIICHSCHKPVKVQEPYTIWEDSIYCEPCFDLYMELITPEDLEK